MAIGSSLSVAVTRTEFLASSPWTNHVIAKLSSPVAVLPVDVTKNGLMDLVVCHDYGPSMLECDMQGGWISWFENPGRDKLGSGPWKQRKIGRWPAMHRMKAGYFTQKSFLEIVAASVIHGAHDKTTPIPIIRFQAPENVLEATEWQRDVIDDSNFTVIHEITTKKFNGLDGLDSMIISSREGTTWLYHEDGTWKRELIGIGEPKEARQSASSETPGSGDHWGTGCADVGKLGDDPFAYIATLDPLDGIAACVYTKTSRRMKSAKWKRHVLDVYGTPNQRQKRGDGPGHFVVCGDFDGDGDDEFLVALFGPLDRDSNGNAIPAQPGFNPNKGIMYYKVIDIEKGLFAKWRIADESSVHIAVGDFGGAGKLDVASIGYTITENNEEPKPVTTLHLNQTVAASEAPSSAPIVSTIWDNEGMIYLAHPADLKTAYQSPLIEIANYAISVEAHPKNSKIPLLPGQGIKVIYGSASDTTTVRRPLADAGFPAVEPVTSDDQSLTADAKKGAIILRFDPLGNPGEYASAADVPVKLTMDTSKLGLQPPSLGFIKVEDLWWGGSFKGLDFYNLTGFYFRFIDDKSEICHMQFWTAGTKVNCGAHNHSDAMFEELHICLSPGTGNGGMSRLISPPDVPTGTDADRFEHVPVPRLHEHGGMWNRDSYGNLVRGKDNVVSYPYHKWQAGDGPNVDVWVALEFNPDLDL
ncbi:hypothetical protein B0T10DRAFT_539220 [Thelonectria olida]|uniref:Aldos-2-ulose dehydratase/isomerase (AUDH) Cupin domain-containing protein n=1 Tax=Thelonectria olida TaxID=1576542 RepID=A0A9P8W3Z1_9HYPO|nr:hypothetical protein B0T10DRAFT_539220 [Thelonectria olida]